MATMADYQVLSDGPFEIDSIVDGFNPVFKTLSFDLPGNFTQGTNRARPILQFIFGALSRDGRFSYWVNVPQDRTLSTSPTGSHFWPERVGPEISTWECLQGDKFRAGARNTIVFGFAPGQNATVRIRDVVLWYQRG